MADQLRPLNLSNFTGGLNLRADAFQLKPEESPSMLNVDVDPRGGVRSRRGWERYNATALGGTWNPKRLHVWDQPDGSRDVLLVHEAVIMTASSGTFAQLNDGSGPVDPAASGHGADFADWGSTIYIACGRSKQSRSWTGSGNAVKLTASAAAAWQNDYTTPVGGHFPKCDLVTTYQGYMVAASTNENSTDYPNRVRFSHPNSPENWAELDYIDIQQGGSKITGIVAFSDHVVVFKTNSVWAIYGNDADSFTVVNLTMAVGAIHRNAIALAEQAVYFYSHPNGVHAYKPGDGIIEVSESLRPIIDSGDLNASYLSKVYLGYLNRRLWFSAPYELDAVATDARSVFVYDPSIGAWTLYRDADGDGLGPYATGGSQGDGAILLAAHRVHSHVVQVDYLDDAKDTIDASNVGFDSYYVTGWQHAGWPALRKSWRRPDYIMSEASAAYTITVDVFRDYDEVSPRSSHNVLVDTGSTGGTWGTGTWGSPATWGGTAVRGARLERGGSIGLARAVQLKFWGEVGKQWGLNGLVMKYRNRRFR